MRSFWMRRISSLGWYLASAWYGTYTKQTLSTVNDLVEATMDDVLYVIQRRIKHDLWLFHSYQHQQGGFFNILEVIELGRVLTKIIATLRYTHRQARTYTDTHR